MNELEFYLNWYDKEAERRTALENSLNIPIGILTITFGLDFYLLSQYDFQFSSVYITLFLTGLVTISFLSSCIATYYLFKSYHSVFKGYTYKAFPFATKLRNHRIELIEYYRQNAAFYPNITGEGKFDEYLIKKLTEYIDKNAYNNDLKSKAIHSSKGFLFIAILSLVMASIPFVINLFQKPEKAYQIEIKNLESVYNKVLKLEEYVRQSGKSDPAISTPCVKPVDSAPATTDPATRQGNQRR